MVNINAVIAVVGATVIFLSAAGLMEIRSRAGPFEEPLVPAGIPLTARGTYVASGPRGTPGPGNVCVPAAGETQCAPARTSVELSIAGLPTPPGTARYQAFLVGEDTLSLGSLVASDGRYVLRFDEARDGRSYRELVTTLENLEGATPMGVALLTFDIAGQGQTAPATLSQISAPIIATGTGTVRAAEIGAFAKSTTAIAQLDGLTEFEGWTYHAWFLTTDGVYISLGAWERDDAVAGHATLDGRVEEMRLEDQRLFLTTLEPAGADGVLPVGVPAFVVDFTQASKAMG
ncbi:MAG TPA: hypothetical protein VGB18_08995 [Candidatus Thermoplasmatota archaeon]